MQARCLVTVAAAAALLVVAAACIADDRGHKNSTAFADSARGPTTAGGWRPARKRQAIDESSAKNSADRAAPTEANSDSDDSQPDIGGPQLPNYFAAAQSPDDYYGWRGTADPRPPSRAASTTPVPDYRGQADFGSRQYDPDLLTAQAPRGTVMSAGAAPFPGAPRPRSGAWSQPEEAVGSRYQEPYHTSPFSKAGPSCPADQVPPPAYSQPYAPPCPAQPGVPFTDPCDPSNFYNYKYTWNQGYFFGVVEGFRFADDDTRLAGRFGLNWGLPLVDDATGWGIQGGYSASVAEGGLQEFATGGIFYRGNMQYGAAFNAGAVIDWMQDNAFDTDLYQVRAKASVYLDRFNELGVWGAVNVRDDDKRNGQTLESVDQANIFYRLLLPGGWDLSPFVGWRQEPDSLALGGNVSVPLSDYWAVIGGGHYTFVGDTWNAFVGLELHWGPHARQDYLGQDRHMPYLPVADNTSMTLFLDRR